MKILDVLTEGPNDPHIFKAIFLAGGPGSGKSFVSSKLLGNTGLRVVNSDDIYEYLMTKQGMSLDPETIFSPAGQSTREKAKEITKRKKQSHIDGRLGLIIDGTGKDVAKYAKTKKTLESLGYETMMLFINTSLDIAQERNLMRPRRLDPTVVEKMWKSVQENLMAFQQLFGASNFYLIDNSGGLEDSSRKENFTRVQKSIDRFINSKPQRPEAKRWLAAQKPNNSLEKTKVSEVLNTQATDAKWTHFDQDMAEMQFTASNGIRYQVNFLAPFMGPDEIYPTDFVDGMTEEEIDQSYFVEFEQMGATGQAKQGVAGTGAAAEVFGIVTNAILEFARKRKPSMIYFQAAEINRRKLYAAIVNRLVKSMSGYTAKQLGDKFAIYSNALVNPTTTNNKVKEARAFQPQVSPLQALINEYLFFSSFGTMEAPGDAKSPDSEAKLNDVITRLAQSNKSLQNLDKQKLEANRDKILNHIHDMMQYAIAHLREHLPPEKFDEKKKQINSVLTKYNATASTNENFSESKVKYKTPNFEHEWEEALRYPEFRKIGKDAWIELAGKGKAVTIRSAKDINNTDAAEPDSFKSLDKTKQGRVLDQLKSGAVEMPIVALYPDGYKELVGGNTRLTAMLAQNGEATVWAFKVPDEVAELAENFADGKKKIQEVFTNPYAINWLSLQKTGESHAEVELPDGSVLDIRFTEIDDGDFDIEFVRNRKIQATGGGDEFRIFATVVKAIKQWWNQMNKDEVFQIMFGASKSDGKEDSKRRNVLYKRFAKQFAQKIGWVATTRETNRAIEFSIIRPEDVADMDLKVIGENAATPITDNDLKRLEFYADKIFRNVGIDVEFTRHFLDRVNDVRNQRQITLAELAVLFRDEYAKWGKKIAQLGPDAQAVMKDMRSDINIPFVLNWDRRNQELDLVAKTVMRKKNFVTPNPEFPVN